MTAWKNIFHKGVVGPFVTWGNEATVVKNNVKQNWGSQIHKQGEVRLISLILHGMQRLAKPSRNTYIFK